MLHIYIYIYIYIYDISSLRVYDLTLILLTWRKWRTPNNASNWQMEFNSAFEALINTKCIRKVCFYSCNNPFALETRETGCQNVSCGEVNGCGIIVETIRNN